MRVGTVLAAVLLIAGVLFSAFEQHVPGATLLAAGCATLVLLPVARLVLMARNFARGDRLFMLLSLLVLTLVIAGAAVGLIIDPR